MKSQNKKIKYTELALIALVWMVLFMTPILFREDIYSPIRRSVVMQLEILIPLSILFLINRFILVPKLLFEGKQILFVVSVVAAIVFFTVGSYYYDSTKRKQLPPDVQQMNNQLALPPYSNPGGVDQFGNLRPSPTKQPRPIPPYANFLILSVLVVGFDTGLRSGLRWIEVENEKVRLEKSKPEYPTNSFEKPDKPTFFYEYPQ